MIVPNPFWTHRIRKILSSIVRNKIVYSISPAIRRWKRYWMNWFANWISSIRCGKHRVTDNRITLHSPSKPIIDTNWCWPHWTNGESVNAKDRVCRQFRVQCTIVHQQIKLKTIRTICAKSKFSFCDLSMARLNHLNRMNTILFQMDLVTEADGMGTFFGVGPSSFECRTNRWSGQRRCITHIRFCHVDHCCQVNVCRLTFREHISQTRIFFCSSLASLGLIGNNIILLVSSMLISPLMNPIVATIFGIVIEDRPLIRFGWANEMFGVLLATIVGLGFGLIVYTFDLYGHGGNAVVTDEMLSQWVEHSFHLSPYAPQSQYSQSTISSTDAKHVHSSWVF